MAAAASIGSVIEWYDFYVFGTSVVLVLGPEFFPNANPLNATLLGFSTFGVGFLTRPLGAVVLSHLGDRVGRQRALVVSLLLMGLATVGVGLLPTYDKVGVLAPLLLVALRLVQGFAVGGEWGGAALLVLEHAPRRRRTLWGTFPQYGTPAGLLLSSIAILLARSLPDQAFLSWGWRMPFLISAVLVVVGLWVRWSVRDADEFLDALKAGRTRRHPLLRTLSKHWRAVLVGTLATFVSHAAYILSTFLPSYATSVLGTSHDAALRSLIVASSFAILTLLVTGLWARERDPRWFALAGSILVGLWAFPAFVLADNAGGTGLIIGVAIGVGMLMVHYGVLPNLLGSQFPVDVRYTGVSLCFQISAVLGGGLLPIVASGAVSSAGGSYAPAAGMLVGAAVLSCVGALLCSRDAS